MSSAIGAKEEATSDESKPENKYDTRGLEASYLAGAQAKRVAELSQVIDQLERFELKSFSEKSPIEVSALVHVDINGESDRYFFLLPYSGGSKIETEGKEVIVITPVSPIGKLLLGKKVGDVFDFRSQSALAEYEINAIW